MKKNLIIYLIAAFAAAVSCAPVSEVNFDVDQNSIRIGAAGGEKTFKVSSPGSWVAMTESPWITVSPANGNGSQECTLMIDSTLVFGERKGVVRIQSLDSDDKKDFEIVQDGFAYQIALKETEMKVDDYAGFGERQFDVKVNANVDFDVVLPDGAASWLSFKKHELNLDRGARPREAVIRFEWKVNSRDIERVAEVVFQPKEDVQMAIHDGLKVVQKAALPIPVNTPAGDSLALLAVGRSLGMFTEWETSERMEHWNNVKIWKDGPNKGRVKYVQFFMFKTLEAIPFEIQYLTAAEEIVIYSNANHFLRNLDTGEYITKLTDLKRLTIGAYGLTSLHPDFVNMKSLEYLDLGSNCFETIPDILTPENFPNLHTLVLSANQRHTIYDLSNTNKTNFGGLFDEAEEDMDGNKIFPKRFLRWDNLDTLRLSVNYLEGVIPDLEDDYGFPKWTAEEVHACDTLPEILIGKPKVLPDTDFFAINLNRLHGTLPDWLLYHPKLDLWYPSSLVFMQEGVASDGTAAGFSNEPANMDYYYEHYVNKKFNPSNLQ